jgi:hypothetical protein
MKKSNDYQWSSKGQYTIQTKTMWGIACLIKPHIQAVSYTPAEISTIIEKMEAIGYTNLNKHSVELYLSSLNGFLFTQGKYRVAYMRDIDKFRIKTGLSKINFNFN